MATIRSMPFDAVSGVPSYGAASLRDLFQLQATDGYVPGLDSELLVIPPATSIMQVQVSPGGFWGKGAGMHLDPAGGNATLTVASNATGSTRKDLVAVYWDLSTALMGFVYLTGTASAPTTTMLTRTSSRWEWALAEVDVTNGATAITAGMITDLRGNTTWCGAAVARLVNPYTDLVHPYDLSPTANVLVRKIPGAAATVTPAAGKAWEVLGFSGGGGVLGNASSPTFTYAQTTSNTDMWFARPFMLAAASNIYLASATMLHVREYAALATVAPVLITLNSSGAVTYTVPTGSELIVSRAFIGTAPTSTYLSAPYVYDNGYGSSFKYLTAAPAVAVVSGTPAINFTLGVGVVSSTLIAPADPQMPEPVPVPSGRVLASSSGIIYLMGYLKVSGWTIQNS